MLYYAAVEEVGERASVIAATGTYDTRHSAHLTGQAAEFVDGFLIVVPYYSKPPARGIVEHYKTIAGRDREADRRLQHPQPRGRQRRARDAGSSSRRSRTWSPSSRPTPISSRRAGSSRRPASMLYAGNDDLVLPFLELGGAGGICVYTHLAGPRVQEMVRRFRSGNLDRGPGAQRRAAAADRRALRLRQPDLDQGRAQPGRLRGRRPTPAARRGDGRRDRSRFAPCSSGPRCSRPQHGPELAFSAGDSVRPSATGLPTGINSN